MAQLRQATGAAHERVDAAFSTLGLADRAHYAAFLRAHARALPAAERVMAAVPLAREIAFRTPLLTADLADLDVAPPAPLAFDVAGEARAWGVLYVVEGSRLGGAMLARMVPEGLPSRYLAAVHAPGQWRAIRTAIDGAGATHGDGWTREMIAGALDCFDLYERAAAHP